MKNRIIEIVELGQPKSIIQRENEPITELIDTNTLVEELNSMLRLTAIVERLPSICVNGYSNPTFCLHLGRCKLCS